MMVGLVQTSGAYHSLVDEETGQRQMWRRRWDFEDILLPQAIFVLFFLIPKSP